MRPGLQGKARMPYLVEAATDKPYRLLTKLAHWRCALELLSRLPPTAWADISLDLAAIATLPPRLLVELLHSLRRASPQ